LLIVFAAALRLTVFASTIAQEPSRAVVTDSSGYIVLARHLSAAFIHNDHRYLRLSVIRTPLYPLVASPLLAIWNSPAAVVLFQLAVSVGIAVMAAKFARQVAGNVAGMAAGVLVAVDPVSVINAHFVQTETVFTALLTGGVYVLWKACKAGSWSRAALAGSLFAAATLTRPVTIYMVPLVIALAYVSTVRRRIVVSFALALAFAAPLAGWTARNFYAADYAGISLIQDVNLLLYRAGGAISEDTGRPLERVQSQLQAEAARRRGAAPTIGDEGRTDRAIAMKELSKHPIGAARSTARGAAAIALGPGGSSWSQLHAGAGHIVDVVLVALLATLLLSSVAGVVLAVMCLPWRRWFMPLGVAIYLLAVSSGPEAYSRFRVPMVPFLAVFGGIAMAAFAKRIKSTEGRYQDELVTGDLRRVD
jgi:4-amino-4-deoxy-L-arabinose transferase-like glycosyltransferase